MHINRLAKRIVGVERIKVRGIAIDGAGALVIDAEPYRARSCRCGKCGREAPRYDAGRGVRLWRCCDVGGMKAYVRSEAFRVSCPECGIVAREVPWAAHGSRFSYAFEDTCCWCALSMSKVACQNPRARAGPWHDRPGTQWGADGPRRASMRRGRRPRWQAAGRPKGFFSSQEKRPCECTGRNRSLVLLGYGPCALSLDSVRRMVASSPQTTDWRGLGDSAVVVR